MTESFSLGLVGCGYWGPNLLRNFHSIDGVDVKVVADRSPERRAFVAKNYPAVQLVEDADQIIDDPTIDAVSIATPAATHGALARRALNAGKDVFVEKPLSLSTDEAVGLARLADAEGRILMVGHSFLYNAAVRELKRRIDAGELGRIYYMYSQRLNLGIVRSDVDAAWNLAPHDVSIGCYLLGQKPVRVTCNGVRALRPGEHGLDDVSFINVTFPDDVVMHAHVSWLDPQKIRRMTVVGDKRMIVYDDVDSDKLRLYDKGIDLADPAPIEQPTDFARFKAIKRAGDLTIPNIHVPEPLNEQCRHFAHCVMTRARPLTDGWNGVQVTAVLEAAGRSARNGGAPEELDIPDA
jgi:predicted dehydrogenase